MERFLTSKGLFLKKINDGRYVLEDVFGLCTLPISAENDETADRVIHGLADVQILCGESDLNDMTGFPSFRWFELEKKYVAALPDHFRYWQVGRKNVEKFDALAYALPIPYFDYGFGDGSKEVLEQLDKIVTAGAENGNAPFTKQYMAIKLAHIQISRMCSDLLSLLQRAITAFLDLLALLRMTIREEHWASDQLNAQEIVHTGPKSYRAATSITICVISLCSSLDISSKLTHFLNSCARPLDRFRGAQGRHYSDLNTLRPTTLPSEIIEEINNRGNNTHEFKSLFQLRHDLIHSTAALEMEKIYVGSATWEINKLPLHYSYIPWRDCIDSGQPKRYLSRDYFTDSGIDIESQLLQWIRAVTDYHLFVGEALHKFLTSNTIEDTGVELATKDSN